jgi:hypothetical protein
MKSRREIKIKLSRLDLIVHKHLTNELIKTISHRLNDGRLYLAELETVTRSELREKDNRV